MLDLYSLALCDELTPHAIRPPATHWPRVPRFAHGLIDQSSLGPDKVQGDLKARIMQLVMMAALLPHYLDAGSIPAASTLLALTHSSQSNYTTLTNQDTSGGADNDPVSPTPTLPVHQHDICLHEKCAYSVHALPEDLALVVAAWNSLPEGVKVGILAIVEAAQRT
jgi:hypothetical protein